LGIIEFGPDDLARFREASHDCNPLHVSEIYARKTPFGEPVVFGVLGLIRAIAAVPGRDPGDLEEVTAQFRAPMFAGVPYGVEVKEKKAGGFKVAILDGDRPVMTASLSYRREPAFGPAGSTDGTCSRTEPARWEASDLREGFEVVGEYAPAPGPFRDLRERCGLPDAGNAASPLAALLWASYLIGMELPGERAAFSRLKLRFLGGHASPAAPISYSARVAGYDERFDLLDVVATLTSGGHPFAEAELASLVRADSPAVDLAALTAALPPSEALRGRRGMVVGGSRGLGAAIVAALASQGCEVILAYRSSRAEAEALAALLPEGWGPVVLAEGDASDEAWCERWRASLDERGGLDLLVCNAVPAIRAMPFGPASVGRIRQFVDASLALAAAPLAAFGPLIEAGGGRAVIVSSLYASERCGDLPEDLHHYVAAKLAVEGLARSLAAAPGRARYLVVRPPKLLTDQTNLAAARRGASPVECIAASIVAQLCQPPPPERLLVIEDFGTPPPA
jgi:NAD(P)-dependent dehydrogenase (short-subunit alcohol dehydrogenase family)